MKPVKRISTDFHFARHTKCFAKSPINSSLNVIAMRRRWMCVHVTFQNCWHKSHISLFLSHTDTPLMRSTKRGWHCINLHFNRSFYGRLKWRQLNALNDRQFIYCFVFFSLASKMLQIEHSLRSIWRSEIQSTELWSHSISIVTHWNPFDRGRRAECRQQKSDRIRLQNREQKFAFESLPRFNFICNSFTRDNVMLSHDILKWRSCNKNWQRRSANKTEWTFAVGNRWQINVHFSHGMNSIDATFLEYFH